jgi:hypothetical protein
MAATVDESEPDPGMIVAWTRSLSVAEVKLFPCVRDMP